MWQEKAPSIVMITNLLEGNRAKCEQYWPQTGSLGFGPFQVTITDQQILADYTVRRLNVQVSYLKDLHRNQFRVSNAR